MTMRRRDMCDRPSRTDRHVCSCFGSYSWDLEGQRSLTLRSRQIADQTRRQGTFPARGRVPWSETRGRSRCRLIAGRGASHDEKLAGRRKLLQGKHERARPMVIPVDYRGGGQGVCLALRWEHSGEEGKVPSSVACATRQIKPK